MISTQPQNLVRITPIKNIFGGRLRHIDRPFNRLSLELILVTITTVSLVSIADSNLSGPWAWLVVPGILAAAALIPTTIRKIGLSEIGLNLYHIRRSLRLTGIACLATLPITYAGLYLLQHYNISAPMVPKAPSGLWINWILYQIMYVAAVEELFFRGYLQSSLLRMVSAASSKYTRIWPMATVIISAVVFALAHVILAHSILSALTFFPGVILGWLFLRTRSLIAPILFHALANLSYALMAGMLI
jgi:membrane protease YdiL (CAAX protease family)